MKIERTITIKYWWNTDSQEIPTGHTEALEESAEERIRSQIAKGYTSGELCDNISMHDSDGDNGIDYRGWWVVATEKTSS